MNEFYDQSEGACCFIQYSDLRPDRKTLLFLHGIGDSSVSYLPFFLDKKLSQFNLLAPDLLGHGKSSANSDYSFDRQCDLIVKQINHLQDKIGFVFEEIILISHSMAGIHSLLLCQSSIKKQIKAFINVEGSITPYGSFVSEAVSRINEKHAFESWFQKFKEISIFNKAITEPVLRSYYASLKFCRPQAFLQNALELRKYSLTWPGKLYAQLTLPKIYCYGDKSLCQESIDFLHENKLETQVFPTDNHFVMLACFDEFVNFICDWLAKTFLD